MSLPSKHKNVATTLDIGVRYQTSDIDVGQRPLYQFVGKESFADVS